MANKLITKVLEALTEGAKVLQVNRKMFVVTEVEPIKRRRRRRKTRAKA